MIYKFASSREIISKVYEDLNFQDENRYGAMYRWIAEACEFIGSYGQWIEKEATLTPVNHMVLLPCDLIGITFVRSGPIPLLRQSKAFSHKIKGDESNDTFGFLSNNENIKKAEAKGEFYFRKDVAGPQDNIDTHRQESSYTYTINGQYLITTGHIKEITIDYTAFMTDEKGLPMIPDNVEFKEACFWYIAKKLVLGGYENKNFDYDKADANWVHYCGAAKNQCNMPDLAKLETIKNMWLRMIPNPNMFSNYFQGNSTEQITKF